MIFTISQVRDYLWCEQYAHNLHTLHRGIERSSKALWLGDLFHQSMAARLLGKPLPFGYGDEFKDPEVTSGFRAMLPFLTTWEVPSSWKVLQVERPLEVPVGRHRLLCRPDALIMDQHGTWLVQWKTLAKGADLGLHQERVRLSFHECGYHWAASTGGMDGQNGAISGTILGTYKKLTKAELSAGTNPFILTRVARDRATVVERVDALALVANRMEESIERDKHLKNTDSCFGRFGNSLCQFYQVCHEQGSLKDPPFVDLPDRYNDL